MAPHETTTMEAEYSTTSPSRSTRTLFTSRPVALVSRRRTNAFVTRVTFGCSSAGSTQITCASAFADTRQGCPSQVLQRMHRLLCLDCSSSMTPSGVWNGRRPCRAKSSDKILQPRLVRDRLVRKRGTCGGFGRVFAAPSVHLIQISALV